MKAGDVRRALRPRVRAAVRATGFDLHRRYPPGLTVEDHLRALLPALRVDCVVDVGAHWGEYGTRVRDAGYRGRIVSFEPVRANADRLAAVAAHDPDWRVSQIALGREAGRLSLNVTANTQFSSFREPEVAAIKAMPGAAVAGHEEVEVKRLDNVLAAHLPRPTSRVFLKLDTQGWDLEVLAGAAGVLGDVVGLQSEISVQPVYEGSPHYLEALATYEGLGFQLTGLFPVARDPQLRLIELDCVMVRADAAPATG